MKCHPGFGGIWSNRMKWETRNCCGSEFLDCMFLRLFCRINNGQLMWGRRHPSGQDGLPDDPREYPEGWLEFLFREIPVSIFNENHPS